MKPKRRIPNLLFIILAACSISLFAQETHTITLYVNTAEISNQDTNAFCNFGQGGDIPNEEFTIKVRNLDTVVWEGVSTSSTDDEVLVNAINHEGGKNVFDKNVLKDTRDNPGVVQGQVVNGEVGDEQKYKISFKVTNNGNSRNGTFHIDPKIKVTN